MPKKKTDVDTGLPLGEVSPFLGADNDDEFEAELEEARKQAALDDATDDSPDTGLEDDTDGVDTDELGGGEQDTPPKDEDGPTPDGGEDPSGEGDDPAPNDDDGPDNSDPNTDGDTPDSGTDDPSKAKPEAINVPKPRLDKEIKKRRAAEDRAKELEQQLATAVAEQNKKTGDKIDIDALSEEMSDAILDGKPAEFAKRLKVLLADVESRTIEKTLSEVPNLANTAVETRQKQESFDDVVTRLEDTFDVVNPGSETFDEDFVDDVLALQHAYVKRGETPAEAMQKAFEKTLRMDKPDIYQEHFEQTDTPDAPQPDTDKNAKRTKQALKKKLELADKQPPKPESGKGNRSTESLTVDLENISEEEFDALPESKKRELRGDAL